MSYRLTLEGRLLLDALTFRAKELEVTVSNRKEVEKLVPFFKKSCPAALKRAEIILRRQKKNPTTGALNRTMAELIQLLFQYKGTDE